MGFPGGSVVKNPPAKAGVASSIRGSGRSPGEENDNLLKYSCLGILCMDRGAWQAAIYGVAKELDTTERLNSSSSMSNESVMSSNHLVLCHPLLLLPSIFPSIRVFSNELLLRI